MVSCFKRIASLSLLAFAISCGQNGDAPGLLSGIDGKRIFVYTETIGNMGGVAGADNICDTQAGGKGLSGTYKAFLIANTRRACSSANCSGGISENLDWVLQPSTNYYREDGTTLVGTTNASAIFNLPLTNSMEVAGSFIWTGLRQDWTNETNCLNWTSDSGGLFTTVGNILATDANAISAGVTACSNNYNLACVEQ